MRKDICGVLIALLACALLGAPAGAEGLMEAALAGGRTITGTATIALGDVDAEPTDEANAALNAVLGDALLRVTLTRVGDGTEFGAAVELEGEALLWANLTVGNEEAALETSLLPERTFVLPAAMMRFPGGGAERFGAVIEGWIESHEGIAQWSEGDAEGDFARNTAVRTLVIRAGDGQLRELLRELLAALSEDIAFAPADMPWIDQAMAALEAPLNAGAEITFGYNGDGEMIDFISVLTPSGGSLAGAQGSVAFSRRWTDDAHGTSTCDISLTLGGGGALEGQFYAGDSRPNPLFPDQKGYEYGGRARISDADAVKLTLEMAGRMRASVKDGVETLEHSFDLRLSQDTGADLSDMASLLQLPMLDVGFVLKAQTEAVGDADFRSTGTLALALMGATVNFDFALESSEYVPVERAEGNAVIRLDALTPEEQAALSQELEANLQALLQEMMPRLMPEQGK